MEIGNLELGIGNWKLKIGIWSLEFGENLQTHRTNGTLERITYKNIHAVGVDLLLDIQMWYPCQNQSGMHNYELCR